MDYILESPLNQTISVFDFTITDEETNEGTYVKTEYKAFVFTDNRRVIRDKYETYEDKTCFLIKTEPSRDAKVLPSVTVETNVNNTNAQTITSIQALVNHDGIIEGYEVVLL